MSEIVNSALLVFAAFFGSTMPFTLYLTNKQNKILKEKINKLHAEIKILEKMIIQLIAAKKMEAIIDANTQ